MVRPRIVRIILAGAMAIHAAGAVAWGQTPARVPSEEEAWLKWVIAGGLAIVICLSGFLNAKRSHLT